MEPRQSSSEHMPLRPSSPEAGSFTPENTGASPPSVETGFDGSRNEQAERKVGHQVEAAAKSPSQQQATVSLPTPVTDDTSTAVTVDDDMPISAADEDLIEKEWVDKAKKVITSTRDDPYRRELEVKKLQLEYIKKRYGKIIGDSGDE